jgi:hypothetical protein
MQEEVALRGDVKVPWLRVLRNLSQWLCRTYGAMRNVPGPSLGTSQYLEKPRSAHSATDTHGDDDVLHTAPFALDQRMADHART